MKKLISIMLICVFGGCVEPFEFETETFENALVVEASLTNKTKRHLVKLSRTFRFEEETAAPERNAVVQISDEFQNIIRFQEVEPGQYFSIDEFAAQPNINYTLAITTSDGVDYISSAESFTSGATITSVYAERETNVNGDDGIAIYLNAEDPSSNSQYYRYEYEETYKIIAPKWRSIDFKLTNYDPCGLPTITYDLEISERDEEQQICYNTLRSQNIIQNSTVELSSNNIENFPVRFIQGDDFILSHRYSILVKQFTQSDEAFSYYQNLGNFSSSENVFSEIQPGFLEGNISSSNDENMVLGFFEVASVSEKRLFFNYEDFYPDTPLPPYVSNCREFSAPLEHVSFCFMGPLGPNPCPQSLIERINLDLISYVGTNGENIGVCPGPYVVVARECGDCTVLGSNVVPDFWVE